ncbi:MAG TPA: sugar ABC transporter substrate-binding protein [Chloroflexota bacterium]|nr:sugar ABC transporter substrate-binding protein [Chloroflexota bacterium]
MTGLGNRAAFVGRRRVLVGVAGVGSTSGVLAAACAIGRGAAGTPGAGGTLKVGTRLEVIAWGGPPAQDVRAQLLERFAQQYPGLSGGYSEPGTYFEKLDAMLTAGTPPDVFFMNPYFFKSYVLRRAALNLGPLIQRDRVDVSDFYPVARGLFTHRNDLWGMPLHFNGINLAFNKQAFDSIALGYPSQDLTKRVWTFDEHLDACRRLTRREGDEVKQWGTSVNTAFQWYLSFVYANGGDLVNREQTICTLDEPPAVEALQYLQDLVHRHRVAAITSHLSELGLNLLTGFTSGRTAMFWPSGAPQFGQIRPVAPFAWDVGILPVARGKPATGMGAPGYMVAKDTKAPDEAWVLSAWLTSKEAQVAEVQAGTITPSRKSVAFSPEFLDQRPPDNVKVVSETLETIKLPPQLANWQEFQDALTREMAPLWTGSKTAREAALATKQQLDPLLREARRLEDAVK